MPLKYNVYMYPFINSKIKKYKQKTNLHAHIFVGT